MLSQWRTIRKTYCCTACKTGNMCFYTRNLNEPYLCYWPCPEMLLAQPNAFGIHPCSKDPRGPRSGHTVRPRAMATGHPEHGSWCCFCSKPRTQGTKSGKQPVPVGARVHLVPQGAQGRCDLLSLTSLYQCTSKSQ